MDMKQRIMDLKLSFLFASIGAFFFVIWLDIFIESLVLKLSLWIVIGGVYMYFSHYVNKELRK